MNRTISSLIGMGLLSSSIQAQTACDTPSYYLNGQESLDSADFLSGELQLDDIIDPFDAGLSDLLETCAYDLVSASESNALTEEMEIALTEALSVAAYSADAYQSMMMLPWPPVRGNPGRRVRPTNPSQLPHGPTSPRVNPGRRVTPGTRPTPGFEHNRKPLVPELTPRRSTPQNPNRQYPQGPFKPGRGLPAPEIRPGRMVPAVNLISCVAAARARMTACLTAAGSNGPAAFTCWANFAKEVLSCYTRYLTPGPGGGAGGVGGM